MNKLIIITGISGVGKTTIAKEIHHHYTNSTIISLDKFKECIWELIGYKNIEQKNELKVFIYNMYKEILSHCMNRKDELIVIEYPFNISWKNIFEELLEKYNYEAITVNIRGNSYDSIYKKLDERNNSINRHPGHSLASYNPKYKDEYKSFNEIEYDDLKDDYINNKYTSIELGDIIDYINEDGKSFDKLINKIDKIINKTS